MTGKNRLDDAMKREVVYIHLANKRKGSKLHASSHHRDIQLQRFKQAAQILNLCAAGSPRRK
jgi:hypothetical protein